MSKKKSFNPWPYGLAVALIAFCTVQFSLVALASTSFEGLDDVEYYRHGVEYGKEIRRQERQADLGWTIAHNLKTEATTEKAFPLRVALLDFDQKPVMKAKVKVKVGRPATLRDDRIYELKEVGPGIYVSDIKLTSGHWKFSLEAEKKKDIVLVEFRHKLDAQPPSEQPQVSSIVKEGT